MLLTGPTSSKGSCIVPIIIVIFIFLCPAWFVGRMTGKVGPLPQPAHAASVEVQGDIVDSTVIMDTAGDDTYNVNPENNTGEVIKSTGMVTIIAIFSGVMLLWRIFGGR